MTSLEISVIGAGIVGLASAWRLHQQYPDAQITVIDKEDEHGVHQSGHNSGVLHTGIYYRPGSKKARLSTAGRQQMIEFCEQRQIAYELCGKVIVATSDSDLPRLDELERRAHANGVRVSRIASAELNAIEPHASGIAALVVPDAGICDYPAVGDALVAELTEAGARFAMGSPVVSVVERDDGVVLTTQDAAEIRCDVVLACAGLHSDRLARQQHPDLDEAIMPFRGEYYELTPQASHLVNHLIYPVPDPEFPFLGVHMTRMINGSIHAGPNAVLALAREGYTWRDISVGDTTEVLRNPGWWRLARRYWRTGIGEYHRSFSKSAFVAALQRLVPEVASDDLVRSPAGVRAQAVRSDGVLVDDFVWRKSARTLQVVNAPSPAATASLAIGMTLANQIGGLLDDLR